ncbi:FAD-binding protein [Myxococcota bacterium]|nr:FAD-binding protein [Myxococcota bacterium]
MSTVGGRLPWANWAGTASCRAAERLCPRDEAELATLVARAADQGRRVKVPGSGHSWSAIAAPEDRWISLERLPATVQVDGDIVRVAGQVPLHRLCAALEAQGRMLPNLGTITQQAVAGATATGTHGTGAGLPVLSAGVVGMRMVDGRGQVVELDEGHPDLQDARVHLGALGIVTELRLRTIAHGRLEERLRSMPFSQALEQWEELAATHRHLRLWWLPRAGVVQVYTADLTDAPDTGPNALAVRLDRWGVQQPVFALLLALARLAPALVPAIHRFAQATSFPDRRRVEDARKVLTMPVPPRHQEVELSVDRAQTRQALQAWWALLERAPYTPDFIQELRLVAADDAALSPATGRDSLYLGAYCTNPATAARYFPQVLALGRELGARPHWGKQFDHGADELAALYPRWADFQALRRRHDPAGVFRNGFLDRVLGG